MSQISFASNFPQDISHLKGRVLPSIKLRATDSKDLDLSTLKGWTVMFMQPGANREIKATNAWRETVGQTPGALGCTEQCQAFNILARHFSQLGVAIFGISGECHLNQCEVVHALSLSYSLLCDEKCELLQILNLRQVQCPKGEMLHPRAILLFDGGVIRDSFVPPLTIEGLQRSAGSALERVMLKIQPPIDLSNSSLPPLQ